MKRILILIKGLGRGGAEQLLVSAAPHLDRSRFHYEVAYVLPAKDALAAELGRHGLPVSCLGGGDATAWVRSLRSLVRERRIDLVHAHLPYAAIGARLALTGGGGPRLVYTEHNVWQSYRPPTYWANLLTFNRTDHVFTVSDEVRASIRYPRGLRWLRLPPVETLYQGLDGAALEQPPPLDGVREEFGIAPHAPVVGTVANFRHEKGHDHLLHAADIVRRTVPGVRFLLVGQGPLEEKVRRQAELLRLGDTVVFTGFREDVPRLCAAIDVFALSSLHEGLSIALLEAMALGKPPVVTRVGGLPELVEDHRHGLLVAPADPAALAAAITALLQDPALRDRLGRAARRRAAEFDIRSTVRRQEELYGQLLAGVLS
jgi:glycosyltransferase involved in cell wall biosynthesis